MKTLTAYIEYSPEHFNVNCNATIPAAWTAEVYNGVDFLDDCPEYATRRIYGIGSSRQEAIKALVSNLQSFGIHGKLKIA